jgi:hypothetical protein
MPTPKRVFDNLLAVQNLSLRRPREVALVLHSPRKAHWPPARSKAACQEKAQSAQPKRHSIMLAPFLDAARISAAGANMRPGAAAHMEDTSSRTWKATPRTLWFESERVSSLTALTLPRDTAQCKAVQPEYCPCRISSEMKTIQSQCCVQFIKGSYQVVQTAWIGTSRCRHALVLHRAEGRFGFFVSSTVCVGSALEQGSNGRRVVEIGIGN